MVYRWSPYDDKFLRQYHSHVPAENYGKESGIGLLPGYDTDDGHVRLRGGCGYHPYFLPEKDQDI